MEFNLDFMKLRDDAYIPSPPREGDVGVDLRACEHAFLPAGGVRAVSTGIRLANPPGTFGGGAKVKAYAKIEGRSGLATKGIFPIGGIIDPSYEGEIKVILYNTGLLYEVMKGDKIAQLVLYHVIYPDRDTYLTVRELDQHGQLLNVAHSDDNSRRGAAGFGSTGV